ATHVWVLDPLDGTNNFGRGIPGFSVSVGILRGGRPLAGAVYDPLSDQLFRAAEGKGAWCNERELRVEPAALGPRSLFTVRTPFRGGALSGVEGGLRLCRIRGRGSPALHLCAAPRGALAIVPARGASLGDIAGAPPIVLEAGGRSPTAAGDELSPTPA